MARHEISRNLDLTEEDSMKKIMGITFGGLQHKTIRLVLSMLLMTIALFVVISRYQSGKLVDIVGDARTKQQEAITRISEETMHAMLESSVVGTVRLEADIADSDFSEVISYLYMMKSMAEGLLESKDGMVPAEVYPPDPAMDGTAAAQALYEEGVDYTKSEYLGIIAHMTSPMLTLYTNCPKINSCYVGLSDGTLLSFDVHSANRFDENGRQIPFPVRERPWYTGAVEAGGIYFAGVMEDAYSGDVGLTCSVPIYDNGEVAGVAGIDIVLDKMNDFVHAVTENGGGFSFIVNDRGQVVISPDHIEGLDVTTFDKAQDLRETEDEAFSQFIIKALSEDTDLTTFNIQGKDYYLVSSPIPSVGWAVVLAVDREATEQPTVQMLNSIETINQDARAAFNDGSDRIQRNALFMIIGLLLIGALASVFVSGRIVKPVESMTRNIVESGRTGKLFEMKDSYKTNDEIQVLAEAFDDLSKKTRKYIQDITRITQEKERISTELELARKIQADMLPNIYPAFPDRPEFDIFATMNPAKEVGGDFYDFFLVDKDHLGMVIADVSGKGVPAALFMMMAKILINNFAMMEESPARVLELTNHAICQNNEEEMFVTAWLGILEISTGKIIAANAGHEYPIIRKADGQFELFKDRHGFVLGGLENSKYREYEMILEKGGQLFLYTDGVPEAADPDYNLFGVKRLIETLNQSNTSMPVELLAYVKNAVSKFAGEADQFDDLTMLSITYLGKQDS